MAKLKQESKGSGVEQLALFYFSKGDMAKALSSQRDITLPDARSRISLAKVKDYIVETKIKHPKTGAVISCGEAKVFETPEKYIDWDGTVQQGRPKKQSIL